MGSRSPSGSAFSSLALSTFPSGAAGGGEDWVGGLLAKTLNFLGGSAHAEPPWECTVCLSKAGGVDYQGSCASVTVLT